MFSQKTFLWHSQLLLLVLIGGKRGTDSSLEIICCGAFLIFFYQCQVFQKSSIKQFLFIVLAQMQSNCFAYWSHDMLNILSCSKTPISNFYQSSQFWTCKIHKKDMKINSYYTYLQPHHDQKKTKNPITYLCKREREATRRHDDASRAQKVKTLITAFESRKSSY